MSTKIEKWKASDSQLFDTEEEADRHEVIVEFVDYLEDEFGLGRDVIAVVADLKESEWVIGRENNE